jgi:hypothetical protein
VHGRAGNPKLWLLRYPQSEPHVATINIINFNSFDFLKASKRAQQWRLVGSWLV